MGAPPSVVGAVQVTVAPALPGVAVTLVGAPGAWAPIGVAVIAMLLTAWRSVMPPSPAVKPSRVVGDRVTGGCRDRGAVDADGQLAAGDLDADVSGGAAQGWHGRGGGFPGQVVVVGAAVAGGDADEVVGGVGAVGEGVQGHRDAGDAGVAQSAAVDADLGGGGAGGGVGQGEGHAVGAAAEVSRRRGRRSRWRRLNEEATEVNEEETGGEQRGAGRVRGWSRRSVAGCRRSGPRCR